MELNSVGWATIRLSLTPLIKKWPTQAPKTRGKSPGRVQGASQPPRTRYPRVRKRVSKRMKAKIVQKTAA